MTIEADLGFDARGLADASVAPPHEQWGAFLRGDVQGDPRATRELLDVAHRVRKGELDEWEGTGNAFTLTITPAVATLENAILLAEPGGELPLDDFIHLLERWAALLARRV